MNKKHLWIIIITLVVIIALVGVLIFSRSCKKEPKPTETTTTLVPTDPKANIVHHIKERGKNGIAEMDYVESDLTKDSTQYQDRLAKFTVGLSLLTYGVRGRTKDPVEDAIAQIKDSGTESGQSLYTEAEEKYTKNKGGDSDGKFSPFWIFKRNEPIRMDGENCNIVFVIVQGTQAEEWSSNFESGLNDKVHKGFDIAANEVFDSLKETMKLLANEKTKIIITGHSRGGAVANLVAAKIDEGLGDSVFTDVTKDDVFAYTYATPNVSRANVKNAKYQNIFNIVNPEDFVTRVMPSEWGYGRYGQTLNLPSSNKNNSQAAYKKYLEKARNIAEQFDGVKYEPFPGGTKTIDYYMKSVSDDVKNNKEYYKKSLNKHSEDDKYSLHYFYRTIIGAAMGASDGGKNDLKDKARDVLFNTIRGFYGKVGTATLKFLLTNQGMAMIFEKYPQAKNIAGKFVKSDFSKYFESAHQIETYYAFVNVLDEDDYVK